MNVRECETFADKEGLGREDFLEGVESPLDPAKVVRVQLFRREVGMKKGPNDSVTNRLRVRNLVDKEVIQQSGENLDLGIGEVDPLVNEGLFFNGSTQQNGGVWATASDN